MEKNNLERKHLIIAITELARRYKKEKGLSWALASALLYSNLAEFFAEKLLIDIEEKINEACLKEESQVGISKSRNKRTDLEATIKQLEIFEFNQKREIMDLLHEIKNHRNQVLHKISSAPKEKINIDSCIKQIQDKTEQLITLCA